MQIIIQGDDKRKAKTWLQFAKNKLRQIKSFTPAMVVINRVFRPVSDVLVHVKSINGLDTIRIKTEGGKYMCDFPIVDKYLIPHSDFQLRCPVIPGSDSPLNIGFLSKSNDISIGGDWDSYVWDFGDGNFDSGASVFHEYDKPGEYTVSLTVSKDVTSANAPGGDTGGEYKYGEDILFPGADPNVAYANYLAFSPVSNNVAYKWRHEASHNWQGKERYSFESQDSLATFDLTAVDPTATVTCKIQLLLLDWVVHYPNYGDAGHKEGGIATSVTSSLGVTAIPIIGGEFAPWETFNMGDLTPFIGSVVPVTFADTGGHLQLPTFLPGTPPFDLARSNIIGTLGSGSWAVVDTPGTLLKTTKVIRVNSGRRGNKRTYQVGDSVHT
jgi:hypothetical protein